MVEPGRFATPPVTIDPATGKGELSGRDALPWALDTLRLGGDIRARYIRLQNWVRTVWLAEPARGKTDAPAKNSPDRRVERPARKKRFGIF